MAICDRYRSAARVSAPPCVHAQLGFVRSENERQSDHLCSSVAGVVSRGTERVSVADVEQVATEAVVLSITSHSWKPPLLR